MSPDEFTEIMKELEREYDYYISISDSQGAEMILGEMRALEANYGRGG